MDGDSVYGISARGANHAQGEASFYDNTVTSASAEDQFSTAKTFDELLGANLYSASGWDTQKWLMVANELPQVACFSMPVEPEATADAAAAAATPRPSTNSVRATGISLNHSSASMAAGQTLQLKATISPRNATNQRVTWSSADTAIATVSSKGLVTAVKAGNVQVTAKTYDGWYTATCNVTVGQGLTLSLNTTAVQMVMGQSASLTATMSGGDTSGKRITWTNSDTSVVSFVSSGDTLSGTLTPLKQGTAKITATITDTGIATICTVTVGSGASIDVTAITLSQTSASMQQGNTMRLTATLWPENATEKSVSWRSDNEAAAVVGNDGTVTAVGGGTATITATSSNGMTATCIITVTGLSTEEPVSTPTPTEAVSEATPEPTPEPTEVVQEATPAPTEAPAEATPVVETPAEDNSGE